MVGTTIRAALVEGIIVCLMFLLPCVFHYLLYPSTILGRVRCCTKVRWVGGVRRVLLLARHLKPPFPFPL